jgi:hypothetical protein
MPQQALIDLIAQNLTQHSSSDRITGAELREVMYTLVSDLYGEFLTETQINTIVSGLETEISNKVDKVTGKGLSTNDFTDILKTKLDGIASGAEVNVNADWNASSGDAQILNKPTSMTPTSHASTHTNGVDDIQLATALQKGLMSSTYASKLDGIANGANVGVIPNSPITGATKTKITYDSKGLVTSGADATTADISDSSDKRYQTDNQKLYNDATSSIQTQLNNKQASLGYTAENTANKTTDGTLSANSDTLYPSEKAVKTYADTKEPAISKSTGILSWTGSAWSWITTTFQDASKLVTSWSATVLDTNYPSEKLTKNSLDLKLNIPTQIKTIPIDADNIIVKDSADSNKYKDVLKANLNEVYIGDTTPTHNEKVWFDTTNTTNFSFFSSSSATISPDFNYNTYKVNSNYASGNTVAISGYTNLPINQDDDERTLVIKNNNASDRIFVPTSSDQTIGSITYSFTLMNTNTITVPTGKLLEINYKFLFTSSNTCIVSILFVVQP